MTDSPSNPRATAPTETPVAPVFRPGDVLCRIDDIPDPGSKGPFNVAFDGEETEIFVVHKDGKIYGYVNVCPHRYMPLNWKNDAFLTFDKSKILCVVHAAIFRIEDGACLTTHCFEGLSPVVLAVENGDVRLVGLGGAPVEG